MIIHDVIWLENVEDKIIAKHSVQPYEVEEALLNHPHVRFMERGHQPGEDLYAAFSRSGGGRYLTIYFICKLSGAVLIVTARDMTPKEKRNYGRK